MLEQMRIPFHSERATAHMEEFVVDEAGHISSPTDGDRPMSSASTGEDRPLPSFGSTVKMSKTASVGSTTIPDITGRKGSTATLDSVPEGDFDELDSARSSVWSHNSSRERIAKQELFAGKRGTGSLRRLQDFVMVTSDVTTSENGEIKKKKVIFR